MNTSLATCFEALSGNVAYDGRIKRICPQRELYELAEYRVSGRYYITVAVVILLMDLISTLDIEIEMVWKRGRRFTWVLVFFCINRYFPPVFYVVTLVCLDDYTLSNEFCLSVFRWVPSALIIFSEIVIGALLMAKISVLYKAHTPSVQWTVIGSTMVLFILQIGLSFTIARHTKSYGPLRTLYMGCILAFTDSSYTSDATELNLILLWFTNILFNVFIFVFTFKKTAGIRELGDNRAFTLHSVILDDATKYFLVMVGVKLTNLVVLIFQPRWSIISWLSNHVIDVILTSRVFLHLREESRRSQRGEGELLPRTDLQFSVPKTPAIVVHIAASSSPIAFEQGSFSSPAGYPVRNVVQDILEREGYTPLYVRGSWNEIIYGNPLPAVFKARSVAVRKVETSADTTKRRHSFS